MQVTEMPIPFSHLPQTFTVGRNEQHLGKRTSLQRVQNKTEVTTSDIDT